MGEQGGEPAVAILAFAPMPLFASYGLLTAVMIALALVATLLDGRVPVMTS